LRRHDGGDHRHAVRARGQHVYRSLDGDPANADDGDVDSAPAGGERLEARQDGVALRRRRIHGAHPEVIRAVLFGSHRFLDGSRRDADQ